MPMKQNKNVLKNSSNFTIQKTAKGNVLVEGNGEKFYLRGVVQEIHSTKKLNPLGCKKSRIHKSPNYVPASSDRKFSAVGKKTGRLYLVKGAVIKQLSSVSAHKSGNNGNTLKQSERRSQKETNSEADSKSYADQLAKIAAEKNAGGDPLVRLKFIIQYVGESRSNIYRKINNGFFPKQRKRNGGRGSYWLLSEIDSYKVAQDGPNAKRG